MKHAAWVGGALLLLSIANATNGHMVPYEPPGGHWVGCEDFLPWATPPDGYNFYVCTDVGGKKWMIINHTLGPRTCTEVVAAGAPDGYQHFRCAEQYELLIKPYKEVPDVTRTAIKP